MLDPEGERAMTMPEVLVNGKRWMPADDYERLKEDLREAYKRIHGVKALAVEDEILRAENNALEVEVDRLRDGIKKYCHVTENALEMWEHEDSYATLKALIENEV